ncbi:MAG: fumarylacetoacetate hydrolase family protein [Mariniblastus sp.]
MIKIFRDQHDYVLQNSQQAIRVNDFSFDQLFRSADPVDYARQFFDADGISQVDIQTLQTHPWLAPIANQEVWAAGVTYFRSRSARMEESEQSGGDRFYDMVYEAERPELFFKATGPRSRGHLAKVCIRTDSTWDVPEPELTLAINQAGKIFGYTIGNDMSSRSIEGDNPLYLPQAKVYRGSCAIGPCLTINESDDVITKESEIKIAIQRGDKEMFSGSTEVSQIKRSFEELAKYLFQDNEFPDGAYLMTGTGVVPESDFTLQSGDAIHIAIDGLGQLSNTVE